VGIIVGCGSSRLSAPIGYVFFKAFVRSEGIEMTALETELALAHRLQETVVPAIELATTGRVLGAVYAHTPKPADDCSLLLLRYR